MGKRILKLIKPRPKGGRVVGKFYIVVSDDVNAGKFYARAWKGDDVLPFANPVFISAAARDNWVDGIAVAATA